jgi:hypothetical protein
MEKGLLLTCLNKEWYAANKGKLDPSFFRGELSKIYETIRDCHEKHDGDLTIDEVVALWRAAHPAIPQVQRLNMEELSYDIKREKPFREPIATSVINGMWRHEIGRRIYGLGLSMYSDGADNLANTRRAVEVYDPLVSSGRTDHSLWRAMPP